MRRQVAALTPVVLFAVVGLCGPARAGEPEKPAALAVDHRFAPPWWQTSICLPDDWQKTLVAKEGTLLYDFPGKFSGFKTRIGLDLAEPAQWVRQELTSPRVPIVRTIKRSGTIEIQAAAIAATPEEAGDAPSPGPDPNAKPPRLDILHANYHNIGKTPVSIVPLLTIESTLPIVVDDKARPRWVSIGDSLLVYPRPHFKILSQSPDKLVLEFPARQVDPDDGRGVTVGVGRGVPLPKALVGSLGVSYGPIMFFVAAAKYWTKLDLPYGHIEVPDAGIQAQLDSSIRNIYQAREIKNGLPAFQVGPTCYRGLWVVDGSFLMEAVAMLGRADEARAGIRYLLSFQQPDGSIMLIKGHWKETGILLWAVARHARLTGDKKWLEEMWPKVQRAVDYVRAMRKTASADPAAPNFGLIPNGFSDGGLSGSIPEYTNVYWTLAGLRAAIDAARWLGHAAEADAWQREYDDFYAAFRRAAQRDMETDAHGNRYLPISMLKDEKAKSRSPQKAQWAFLHAVFPGKVFAPDDPLVTGNMAMLRAAECEGLVRDTGWAPAGIWTYFGSFYAHAWLWNGDGQKAARTLYAFANHASPLLAWREEQMPVGEGNKPVGDMPHNWASAEFIRLVRHLIVLERGDELHLLEGVPPAWLVPGKSLRLKDVLTEFGPISLELRLAADGREAVLTLDPPRRDPPKRIVLHLAGWSGRDATTDLPTDAKSQRHIPIQGSGEERIPHGSVTSIESHLERALGWDGDSCGSACQLKLARATTQAEKP
ncbi:MAG: hypothetical protein ABR915_17415 [Thermoguttaceae bacterium]|jgi:hypothetical protein